jgi:hypothetical protein
VPARLATLAQSPLSKFHVTVTRWHAAVSQTIQRPLITNARHSKCLHLVNLCTGNTLEEIIIEVINALKERYINEEK